jgi:hypothetical protein
LLSQVHETPVFPAVFSRGPSAIPVTACVIHGVIRRNGAGAVLREDHASATHKKKVGDEI